MQKFDFMQKIEKHFQDIMADASVTDTPFGEPQMWVNLPNGRSLEITHETYGLKERDCYYTWRVHCSDEEFENDDFHSTCGVIDTRISGNEDYETWLKNLLWAYAIAEKI